MSSSVLSFLLQITFKLGAWYVLKSTWGRKTSLAFKRIWHVLVWTIPSKRGHFIRTFHWNKLHFFFLMSIYFYLYLFFIFILYTYKYMFFILYLLIFYFYLLNTDLYLKERKTECEQGRGRERGRHRVQSRLQALSCQHRSLTQGSNPQAVRSQPEQKSDA